MINKELLNILENRFNKNMHRHINVTWSTVLELLTEDKLDTIQKMEETGGEPDFLIQDSEKLYVDFSKESPKGRRSLCYDKDARVNRKKFPPVSSALEMARDLNIELLDEDMYYSMQEIETFDLKSSSWIKTDNEVRNLNGALFGNNRYQRVFVYHNGADSYYKDRGFRGFVRLG
jgi:hypothetical protein